MANLPSTSLPRNEVHKTHLGGLWPFLEHCCSCVWAQTPPRPLSRLRRAILTPLPPWPQVLVGQHPAWYSRIARRPWRPLIPHAHPSGFAEEDLRSLVSLLPKTCVPGLRNDPQCSGGHADGAEASRLRGGQERLLSQVPDDHRLSPCSPAGTSRLILCVAFILCPPTRGSRNPTIRAPPEFSVLFVHQMPLPRKRQALRKKKQWAKNGVTCAEPHVSKPRLSTYLIAASASPRNEPPARQSPSPGRH